MRQKPPPGPFPPFRTLRLPRPRLPPNLNPFQTRRRNLFQVMPMTSGRQSTNLTWPSGNTRTPYNERRRRRSEGNGRLRGHLLAPQPLLVLGLDRVSQSWVNISLRSSMVLRENLVLGGRKSVELVVQPSSPSTPLQCVFSSAFQSIP